MDASTASANGKPWVSRRFNVSEAVRGLIDEFGPVLRADGCLWRWDSSGVWRRLGALEIRNNLASLGGTAFREAHAPKVAAALKDGLCTIDAGPDVRLLVNFKNGMVDPVAGRLLPHDPAHYSRAQLPVDYDQDAGCPSWEAAMGEAVSDPEQAGSLRAFMGHCMAPRIAGAPAALILVDPDGGAAGAIREAVSRLVGPANVTRVQLADVLRGKETASVNFAFGLEPKAMGSPAFDALLAGESSVTKFIVTIAPPDLRHVGDIPRAAGIAVLSSGAGDALALALRDETDGIVRWALDGLRQMLAGEVASPYGAGVASTRGRQPWTRLGVKAFVRDRCHLGADVAAYPSDLFAAYVEWVGDSGVIPLGRNRLYAELVKAFPSIKRHCGGGRGSSRARFVGIALT